MVATFVAGKFPKKEEILARPTEGKVIKRGRGRCEFIRREIKQNPNEPMVNFDLKSGTQ